MLDPPVIVERVEGDGPGHGVPDGAGTRFFDRGRVDHAARIPVAEPVRRCMKSPSARRANDGSKD